MFFMGLFTPFVGAKANVPAIRFGRLSVLTDEKITAVMEDGPQYYYLMEAQVFGGNSGSPALFYFDERRNPGDTKLLLAGVVVAYYLNPAKIEVAPAIAGPYALENVGISLIVPGFRLLEILKSPELKKAELEILNSPEHKKAQAGVQ